MSIKQQLPYIGDSQEDGRVLLFDIEVERPEYEEININGYLGKYECICLLLGVDIISFWTVLADENAKELAKLVNQINNEINFALQNGDLIELKRKESFAVLDYSCFGNGSHEMRIQPYFKVIEFIQWADVMSYNLPSEVEEFKNNIDQTIPLTKQEAQELGMLRKEKEKFKKAIRASVMIGLWLKDIDYRITHNDLIDKIQLEFPDIPKSTINRIIWKVIPTQYKNQGGLIKQKK